MSALAPSGDGGYTWFGEHFPGAGPPGLARAIGERLYADYYTTGFPAPARDRDAVSSPSDLRTRLEAVHRGLRTSDPGWTIRHAGGDGRIEVERSGLRLWVRRADVDAAALEPGADCRLLMPRTSPTWSPGYHTTFGPAGLHPDEVDGRLYVNLRPEGAVELIGLLARGLDREGVRYCLKVVADPRDFDRADALVLYLRASELARALRVTSRALRRVGAHIGHAVPALTLPLEPGLSYAEEPAGRQSFGAHRCGLVAEAIVRAWQAGETAPASCIASVAERFETAGTSLDAPHRTAGGGPDPVPVAVRPRPIPGRARPSRNVGPAEAAMAIGERICRAAVHHDGRCSWIGPAIESRVGLRPETVTRPLDGSLYDGTGGVALFLAELHGATGDPRLRDTARAAFAHAVAWADTAPARGLHGGPAGVALAAARAAHVMGDEALGEASRRLARTPRPHEAETDLLNGLAGTALGLAAMSPDPEGCMLARLEDMADALMARSTPRDAGRSWATTDAASRTDHLLGMAHGASGIGLALATLGVALGRSDLHRAALEATDYERTHVDVATGRWPDLRARGGRTGGRSLTMAWCHGTPGIALARLRIGTLLADPGALAEARHGLDATARALADVLAGGGGDTCLCHGVAGNADILLEGVRCLDDPDPAWAEVAAQAAGAGIDGAGPRGGAWRLGPLTDSPSLMVGEAGVGAFLLRVAEPSVPTVLAVAPAAIPQSTTRRKEAAHAVPIA